MDPYQVILIRAIALIAFLIIIFLAIIIAMRAHDAKKERDYQNKAAAWERYLLEYLQDDINLRSTAFRFRDKINYYLLWRFFAPYLEMLDGKEFDRVKRLCDKIGLTAFFLRKLRSGSTSSKIFAARALNRLRHREAVPGMIRLLKNKNPVAVQAAAQELARAGDPATFSLVAKALLKNTFFTYEGTIEILTGYGTDICSHIVEILEQFLSKPGLMQAKESEEKSKTITDKDEVAPFIYISVMVTLLGYFRFREALPLLNRLLTLADEETTIHILKAYRKIGKVPRDFNLKLFLDHSSWAVRSFGAQLWSITADKSAIPHLERLLSDEYWWVRFHAAMALLSSGKAGIDVLSQLAKKRSGAASEISRYILELSEMKI